MSAEELLGGMKAGRVYPGVLKQNPVLPAIAFQRISTSRDRTADGPTGLVFARVQYDCWAPEFDQARAAAAAVRDALDGYAGQIDGVDVQLVEIDDDRDDYFPDVKLFRVSVDAGVWFSEFTP